MLADTILLNYKYQGIIEEYAQKYGVSLRSALDIFYNSALYDEVSEGISDMHCRSDKYLADELEGEIHYGH
jgi:hypothetical protein